ncbi:accessory Sec system protein translocase subunit SecY2 [Gryllotalpicola reticulitermitis]|uniref:Accessory Sec system protein translocase subunit SecY2 n=1 Tax=Gryllotalpicola reticulitermitis TaxID=1184153 RepID=A0ABV8Q2U7_9MICO
MARIRDGRFASLRTKILWTALFFVCFMIGRNIPIPFLHQTAVGSGAVNTELLNAANVATGGNFFHPSVFSLGLGPWMGAAILWRFLFIGRIARGRKIPEETVNRARNTLMVILAIIQAISLMATYKIEHLTWGPFSEQANAQVLVVVILTAGAIVVAWLANQNQELGLGGITMFILYQIIITAMRNFETLSIAKSEYAHVLWPVIVACVCVVLVGIFAGNAELRLHVNKVSIDSGFTGVSYLPIKLNPAGASPLMYAVTLLALPQYVAHAAGAVIPSAAAGAERFLSAWGLSTPAGFTVYLVLLFGLTIFFGLFTIDPKETARRMKDSGEYFDHVAPGDATRRYLRGRVVLLSALSGAFMVIFTGLPLYFIGSYPNLQFVLQAPQTLMILLGLLWMLQEEIADTLIGKRYVFAYSAAAGRATA